ncbi:Uncharacterised protein [Legionella lansingensis]|uniref:Uncharacterized protein n=1 Tax=Legionella lansingensis TaxID=45067 RepID=A0A0W0VFF9_9GAMM|nr:hypothetical protein [Legionella lansingensis]KTD18831.1 hypothetical protein Llan_2434 [Legionella lansingensis]SNV52884.1 Uncharacterised protein [Legionella lansingensis]
MSQKQFTLAFLQNVLTLLNDENQLCKVSSYFQQEDPNINRYLCRDSFGLHGWNDENAGKFSAVIAEALRQTTTAFFTKDDEQLKLIQRYSDNIKTNLVPKLTANVDTNNPMIAVKLNVEKKLLQLTADKSYFNNPYVLFGGLAATAIVATVAWSLTPK